MKVKELKIGEVVEINNHDYYYKGKQNVKQGGFIKAQVSFWSTSSSFRKYFNLNLMEHTLKPKQGGGGWVW